MRLDLTHKERAQIQCTQILVLNLWKVYKHCFIKICFYISALASANEADEIERWNIIDRDIDNGDPRNGQIQEAVNDIEGVSDYIDVNNDNDDPNNDTRQDQEPEDGIEGMPDFTDEDRDDGDPKKETRPTQEPEDGIGGMSDYTDEYSNNDG